MRLKTSGHQLQTQQINGANMSQKDVASSSLSHLFTSFQRGIVTLINENGIKIELAKLAPATVQAINLRNESEAAIRRMLAIKSWLEALRAAGIDRIEDEPWVRTVIRKLKEGELKDAEARSVRTLENYAHQVDRAEGDWARLIPNLSSRGGRGKVRTGDETNSIIDNLLLTLKEHGRKIIKTKVFQDVLIQVQARNLAYPDQPIIAPSASTVSRRVDNAFTPYEFCVRRNGKKYANRLYRRNAEAREKASLPLLIMEFDDLDTGVFTVTARTCLPFGRAYITHGVDQATTNVMGFSIGHESRSFESAMGVIASFLLPKDMSDPIFAECKHAWEPFGQPGQMLMDKARYNFSQAMRTQSEQLQLLLSGAQAYGPTEKTVSKDLMACVNKTFCPHGHQHG
jgi:hypothetical protein